jgi:upstream activation factor subunit UAF30
MASKAPKTKAPKTKAPKADVPATPTVEPVPVPVPLEGSAENEVVPISVETSCSDMFVHLNKSLHELSAHLANLRAEVRALEKNVSKELRVLDKINAKKNKNKGNRAPSGFVKPTLISKELADFLGKPVGTEWARTEVTREINAYIRTHSLQDKENGRKINPDTKLRSLLQMKKGDELTYFNLQRYMSPHFAKATPVVAVASS